MERILFDSHAHLEDEQFDSDREELISSLPGQGMAYVVNIGTAAAENDATAALTEKYDFIYGTVGIHPSNTAAADEKSWTDMERYLAMPKIVGVGETGLDYYWDDSPHDAQQQAFRRQIALAKKYKKPVVIHDRDAHGDCLRIVREENAGEYGGVFHAYSGSWEMAQQLLDLNFHLAVGGVVTFKNAKKLVEVAEKIPLDRLLIETDSPYLTPEPYRGKRNDPAKVRYVAEKIAEIRGVSFEEIARATLENGRKFFNI